MVIDNLTNDGLYYIEDGNHVYHNKNGVITHLNFMCIDPSSKLKEAHISRVFMDSPKAAILIRNFNKGSRYKAARERLHIHFEKQWEKDTSRNKFNRACRENAERAERLDKLCDDAYKSTMKLFEEMEKS